jgi:tRNA uridine 5-carboxymethylaminomethyl modification enzyme
LTRLVLNMNKYTKSLYDIVVVGGGHAGYEAALSASRTGASTLLITIDNKYIGRLPCNPSVGGIAKSHIVCELDALGGEQARTTDYTGIQFRTLNTRKGPAVQATRVQCDKEFFPARIQKIMTLQDKLDLLEDLVQEVWTENGKLQGVVTRSTGKVKAKTVIIATGTFLRGRVLIGMVSSRQGRMGEEASDELSLSLEKLGFKLGRMKTGTPPRLH